LASSWTRSCSSRSISSPSYNIIVGSAGPASNSSTCKSLTSSSSNSKSSSSSSRPIKSSAFGSSSRSAAVYNLAESFGGVLVTAAGAAGARVAETVAVAGVAVTVAGAGVSRIAYV